jgi:hypothetical protein
MKKYIVTLLFFSIMLKINAQQKKAAVSKATACQYDPETYRDDLAGKISYKFNEPGSYKKSTIQYQIDNRYKTPLNKSYINNVIDKVYNILELGYKNNNGLLIDYDQLVSHSMSTVKPSDKVLAYHLKTTTQHIVCKNGYSSALYYTTPFEIRFNSLWGNADLGTFYNINNKEEIFFYNNNQVYERRPPNAVYLGFDAWIIKNNSQIKEKIESILIAPKGKSVFLPVPNKAHIEYKIRILQDHVSKRIKDIQKKPTKTWEQYQQENDSRFKDRKRAYEKRDAPTSYDKFVEEEKKYWQKQVDAVQHPEEDTYVKKLNDYIKNGEGMLRNESTSFLNAPCYFLAEGESSNIALKRSFYYTKETLSKRYNGYSEYVYYNPELFNAKDSIEKIRFAYIFIGPVSTSNGIVGKADALLEKLHQKLLTEENVKKIAAMLE